MTREEIKQHLAKWEAADAAISANKSYSVDGLSVTKQDAATVREQIRYWSKRLANLDRALHGGCSVTFGGACACDCCRYK